MKEVQFQQWKCLLEIGQYNNGRTALSLIEKDTGEPIAKATINIPDVNISEGDVFIKNYSENAGMLDALIEAKVIFPPFRCEEVGMAIAHVCTLYPNIN